MHSIIPLYVSICQRWLLGTSYEFGGPLLCSLSEKAIGKAMGVVMVGRWLSSLHAQVFTDPDILCIVNIFHQLPTFYMY